MSAPLVRRWMPLLLAGFLAAAAGCQSNADIILERQTMHNHASIAQMYYDAGRYQQAINQAKKALAIDDTYVKAHCILGYLYMQVGRLARSEDDRLTYFAMAETAFTAGVYNGSESNAFVFKCYFGLGLLYFQWAKAVERVTARATGAPRPDEPPDGEGGEVDLWKE